MIKLYQFPSAWNLPNASPFCMKLETYLRMASLPYEIVSVANPRKSPKGKLPVISDGGKKIPDTGFIIDYLKQQYGDKLDQHLTALQKAQALALTRLMEEHLYWIMVYSRWMDERYREVTLKVFFGQLSAPLRYLLPVIVGKKMQRDLYGQGLGRHSRDEMYKLGIDDLSALQTVLGQQPFFMGDQPCSLDACAYAFLVNILYVPVPSPLQDYVKAQPTLVDYCKRMRDRYYTNA